MLRATVTPCPSSYTLKDEDYSGKVLARPDLERVSDLADKGQIDGALIYDPDREAGSSATTKWAFPEAGAMASN